jgi:hypothetical protein
MNAFEKHEQKEKEMRLKAIASGHYNITEPERGFAPRRRGIFVDKKEMETLLNTLWENERDNAFLYFEFRLPGDPQLYAHEGSYLFSRQTSFAGDGSPIYKWSFTNQDFPHKSLISLTLDELTQVWYLGKRF